MPGEITNESAQRELQAPRGALLRSTARAAEGVAGVPSPPRRWRMGAHVAYLVEIDMS